MPTQDIRLTKPALKVLQFLISDLKQHSGAEISLGAHVSSGTLYPLLVRLQAAGWLDSKWEDVDPAVVGRPRRRFYWLTGLGQKRALAELSALQIGELAWKS